MKTPFSILTIASLTICVPTYGQTKKSSELPVDSLYTRDIRNLKIIYPDLWVKEFSGNIMELFPKEVNPTPKRIVVNYPREAIENGEQGTAYCRLIVDTLGQVKDIKVIKDKTGYFTQESIRALTSLATEKLIPYSIDGKKVTLYQKVSMKFVVR